MPERVSRADRYRQVRALRDEGLLLREIAERLGLAVQTVHDVLSDPDGSKAWARRHKRFGICSGCGAKTFSGGARVVPERCAPCAAAKSREDSRRWVLDSMREWAERFGAPPSSYDWNPALIRNRGFEGSQWRLKRLGASGRRWPAVSVVIDNFGSWNTALAAAGFEPLDPRDYALGRAGVALREAA